MPWALQPRHPCGGVLAFIAVASLHGVVRRVARLWRSPSWHLCHGRRLLPVALSLVHFSSESSFTLVDDKREHDQIRLLPHRDSSCSSSLLIVIPSNAVCSSCPPHDSLCRLVVAPLLASYELQDL